ncbi:hypothetical protein Hypma_000604, partial [Hypsizygus marmoreus]
TATGAGFMTRDGRETRGCLQAFSQCH